MSALTFTLLGCLVTAICAGIPFVLSSRQLAAEAQRLHNLLTLIMTTLENDGLAECERDANGEVTSFTLRTTGTAKGTSKVSGIAESVRRSE